MEALTIPQMDVGYFYKNINANAFRAGTGFCVAVDVVNDILNRSFYTVKYYYIEGIYNYWRRTASNRYEMHIKNREFSFFAEDGKKATNETIYAYIKQIQTYCWQIDNQKEIVGKVQYAKSQLLKHMFYDYTALNYQFDKEADVCEWIRMNNYQYGHHDEKELSISIGSLIMDAYR